MTKKRLSKYLSECGVSSRRAAEELIFEGRVKVNGQVVEKPQHLVDRGDQIVVDGKKVKPPESKVYFMLNKPKGYLCSAARPSPTSRLVIDLFHKENKRLFTVGRLDKDTEGLIVVTNDGTLAHKMIHPSSNLTKVYVAKTDREITIEHLKRLSQGTIVQGTKVEPVRIEKVRKNTVKIGIKEGKKREVRQLLEDAGLECIALKRVQLGSLVLGDLPIGSYRALTDKEIALFDPTSR